MMEKAKIILTKMYEVFKRSPQLHFVFVGIVLIIIGRIVVSGSSHTNINILAEVVIYAVVALGLNLLLGFSGLVSLSTAAFMGITTNSMYVFMVDYEISFLMAALMAMIICGLLGLIVGLLSLKMEGIYLGIATLFIGHITIRVIEAFDIFARGNLRRFPQITYFFDFQRSILIRDQRIDLYTLVVIAMVLMFIVIYNIFKSPTGRSLMAISRSQHAALAMGISVRKYRLLAFVIATTVASFGGVLHVAYFQTTGASGKWGLGLSLIILSVVVIGGMKSFHGMLLGSFIIIGIPALYLRDIPFLSGFDDILTGLLIVLVILFYPYGAMQIGYDLKKLYYKAKAKYKARVVKRDE